MKIEKIKAIHSQDIEKYLESLGILNDVNAGRYKCELCGRLITINNITCIYPQNRQVKFCCDDTKCYETIVKKRSE